MKIRTQLVLAFLLLSVLPLTGLVLYNYVSSQEAVRQAVAMESAEMLREMNGRMSELRAELGRGVERVGEIPLPVLERGLTQAETAPRSVIQAVGDAAPLLDTLEVVPAPPAEPSKAAPPAPPVPPAGPVVIDIRKIVEDAGKEAAAGAPENPEVGKAMEEAARIAEGVMEGLAGGKPGGEEHRVIVLHPEKLAEHLAALAERKAALEERQAALEKRRRESRLVLGKDIEAPVWRDGRVVGYVRAQVRPEEVLHRILGRARRDQGEIPFVLDAERNVHAANPADLRKLQGLPVDLRNLVGGGSERILEGWVVVTSKDPESGLTFGVARPIRESLERVKINAIRNFGWGLALIAFALVGILPLSNRLTRDVRHLTHGAERIAQGDLDTRVAVRSRNEIGTLAGMFNRMAGDLRAHQDRLVEQETEQRLLRSEYERKTRELEEARSFQLSLLPKTLPDHPGLAIAVSMQTATEVGGDYYDFHLSTDGVLTTAVGDATGHGARAGTMVTVIKSLFSADSGRSAPREFLAEAAAAVKRMELGRMAMGLTLARLEGRRLTIAAAGMPPALLYRAGSATVEEIALQGMPLGGLAYDYREMRMEVGPGDVLLLMSDGLPELQDGRGEPFGYPRVRSLFEELGGRAPEDVIAGLTAAARYWSGGTNGEPPNDDVTFVAVRVRA
ncbi:MAG: SpoIIE family protein phosphatase [Acidobacteriota bacterium]